MIKLMLCQTIIKRGLINKMKSSLSSVLKPISSSNLLLPAPYYSPLPLMTATGISPKKRRMVFLMSTLLQHDFILAVQNKTEKHDAKALFMCL
jgi:hypothetical protein